MDEREILHHLLEVESAAAELVDSAQSEGERRQADREKTARAAYEAAYSARATELEAEYARKEAAIHTEYRERLDAYRATLDAAPVNERAFSELVENLLFEEH